jgi:hypothetical protein
VFWFSLQLLSETFLIPTRIQQDIINVHTFSSKLPIILVRYYWNSNFLDYFSKNTQTESSLNVMAHGDAREQKWRGNKRMEWVTSKRHMTAEHRLARAVQTLQADVHGSPASSRLNWHPRRFKWTRPFRRKTKSGLCACAITFQTQSTTFHENPFSASRIIADGRTHTANSRFSQFC